MAYLIAFHWLQTKFVWVILVSMCSNEIWLYQCVCFGDDFAMRGPSWSHVLCEYESGHGIELFVILVGRLERLWSICVLISFGIDFLQEIDSFRISSFCLFFLFRSFLQFCLFVAKVKIILKAKGRSYLCGKHTFVVCLRCVNFVCCACVSFVGCSAIK